MATCSGQPIPPPKTGEYILSEADQFQLQRADPADSFHKNGLRPQATRIQMWQSGDSRETYKVQHLNPASGDVLWEVTQDVVNGQVYRRTRDTVAAVEFTIVVPPSNQTAPGSDAAAAEASRRAKLIQDLGQNAPATRLQSTTTGKSIFHVVSHLSFDPASAAGQIVDKRVLNLLDQQPKELKLTYDVDEETYEIIEQSTIAVLPGGSERVVESRRLVARKTGPLSELPGDWFVVQDHTPSAQTYGFDIHQEVSAQRATEAIKTLSGGRFISIITGPASALVKGLQSVAPVWDQSKQVALQVAGTQHQAWLCEGGVLANVPGRRLLIFTSGDKLFYVTGQSFDTNDEFLRAASRELAS